MKDLVLNKNYKKKGNRDKKVRLIQEWLSLQGLGLSIDGDLGLPQILRYGDGGCLYDNK